MRGSLGDLLTFADTRTVCALLRAATLPLEAVRVLSCILLTLSRLCRQTASYAVTQPYTYAQDSCNVWQLETMPQTQRYMPCVTRLLTDCSGSS